MMTDKQRDSGSFAVAIVIAIVVVAWFLLGPPPTLDDWCGGVCPTGARPALVRGVLGWPECICEVAHVH